jgi:hypothetical protein
MQRLILMTCLLAASLAAGQPALDKTLTIRSRSEQFVVQGPREILPSVAFLNASQRTNCVRLDQACLAVMCERVKHAILREFLAADQWRGRIFVTIRPARDLGELVFVKSQYSPAGWFYRIELPSEIEPPRLVRTLVEVLLQEMANRKAGARPAELPPWLAPGLSAHLQTLTGANLIIDDNTPHFQGQFAPVEDPTRTVRIERRIDEVGAIRWRIGDRLPLALDELNWPSDAQLTEPPGGHYEACAQLFVLHLLRLRGGADCLRLMLQEEAPKHLNWQTAFLKAFAPHFKTLRDADKWWSLQIADFSGRDVAHTYNLKESWQKLEEILLAPANLRAATNQLPERVVVTLQTVIGQWDYARQKPALRQKIAQLHLLRLRVAPTLLPLSEDYRKILENYLSRRDRAGFAPDLKQLTADSPRLLARKTVEQLNVLDIMRRDLKNTLEVPMNKSQGPRNDQ